MKNLLFVAIILLAGAAGIAYWRAQDCSYIAKDAFAPLKMAELLSNNGCLDCHDKNTKPPFYADLPLAGYIIENDRLEALRAADLGAVFAALKSGERVCAPVREKLAALSEDCDMPPLIYRLFHPETHLNNAEVSALKEWVKYERLAANSAYPSASQFKTQPVQPLPNAIPFADIKAALGAKLFADTRLSADGSVSCAACHNLKTGGTDRLKVSKGVNGQTGRVNAPTVFNSALNFCQFWDGRAADLQTQAGGPPLNPVEMGSKNWDEIIARLNADQVFKAEFIKVYPKGISAESVTDAIAEFEKTLLTPDARFDLYLKGKTASITEDELKGYEIFKENGCAQCHAGVILGGESFEYLDARYFAHRGGGEGVDLGRANVTNADFERHKFKTPTLRNIAVTYPYFHDGSVPTLKDAVLLMAKYQTQNSLTDEEADKLVKFLETLTGKYQDEYLK